MTQQAPPSGDTDLGQYTVPINDVHINTGQSLVLITEDKLRVCLMDHEKCLSTGLSWVTPVSLFVTLVVVLTTADFKAFVLGADVWHAMFVLGALGTALWSARTLWASFQSRGDLDTLIAAIKQQSQKRSEHAASLARAAATQPQEPDHEIDAGASDQ